MSRQRKSALWLMIVLGAFCLSVTAILVRTYFSERRAGILATAQLTELKRQLQANPKDEALKAQIRSADLHLRQRHFLNRSRFLWAGYLLLAGLIGWVASARWFVSLGEKPLPDSETLLLESLKAQPSPDPPLPSALAVGSIAAVLFLSLGYAAVFVRPAIPPTGWARSGAGQAPAAAAASLGQAQGFTQNWPCFRGPDNIGVAASGDWPTSWSVAQDHNIVWAAEVPAEGKSSPIVWGDRIFLTGGDEAQHHVLCFDRSTGRLLWDSVVKPPQGEEEIELPESTGAAASTPATDGRRVYAVFATGVLAAFDFQGKEAWVYDLGPPQSAYGFASSLMMGDNVLILQFDQGVDSKEGLSELLGFDPESGNVRWKTPRPAANSWSSPAIIRAPERVELVACADPWVIAYDPAGGQELWRAQGLKGDVAPSPTYGGGLIFVAQDGSRLMAIRPGGSGDVTKTHVVWTTDEGMPDICSPVTDGKRLFQLGASSDLTCFDAQQGKLLWKDYIDDSASASPILAGGLVYITSENGLTRILELGDALQFRGQGEVGETVHATPAFADSFIYIRGQKHLFCVGRKP